jgi:hypothetical protein
MDRYELDEAIAGRILDPVPKPPERIEKARRNRIRL